MQNKANLPEAKLTQVFVVEGLMQMLPLWTVEKQSQFVVFHRGERRARRAKG
jgi:hypothetical protein